MIPIEAWNLSLFAQYAAPSAPNPWLDPLAMVLAVGGPWGTAITLTALWLWGSRGQRDRAVLVEAALAGLLGLAVNQAIAAVYFHPRPYMLGLVRPLLTHAYETSFPSDHATLMLAVGLHLGLATPRRWAGAFLTLLGVATAWARVYAGVHFPLDILGSAGVALGCVAAVGGLRRWVRRPVVALVGCYGRMFAPWIERGWVRGVTEP